MKTMKSTPLGFIAVKCLVAVCLAAVCLAGCGMQDQGNLPPPVSDGTLTPRLAESTSGDLILSWQTRLDDEITTLNMSSLTNSGWSKPVQVASGRSWFVNRADFPTVKRIGDTSWLAHWRIRSSQGIQIGYARSSDGITWGSPTILPDRGNPETGFAHVVDSTVAGSETPVLAWIETPAQGSSRLMTSSVDPALHPETLDPSVCDCCQIDGTATVAGYAIVYRGRTGDEVRDIQIIRRIGKRWTDPVTVADDHWKINGCPINGPVIASVDNRLGVVWYTEAQFLPRVLVAFSIDGAAFSPPVEVNVARPLGRVGLAFDASGAAVISYLRHAEAGHTELVVRRLHEGKLSPVKILASFSSRPGFPQLASYQGRIVAAWSVQGRPVTRFVTF